MHLFADRKDGKRLENHVIQTKKTEKLLSCLGFCSNHERCISVNFCAGAVCELNWIGIYDDRGINHVTNFSDCVYSGMIQSDQPACTEDVNTFALKDIRDTQAGLCRINRKRVDSHWGPWGRREEGSVNQLTVVYTRVCSTRAHGGIDGCAGEELEREQEHFLFNHFRFNFYEARNYCAAQGFILWGEVDATVSQIHWMAAKLNSDKYLVGMHKFSRFLLLLWPRRHI